MYCVLVIVLVFKIVDFQLKSIALRAGENPSVIIVTYLFPKKRLLDLPKPFADPIIPMQILSVFSLFLKMPT